MISCIPSAIFLRRFDRQQSRHLNFPELHQPLNMTRIDLRPQTPGSSWRESLNPRLLVQRSLQPINPTITERAIKRFGIRNRFYARILLVNPQPDSRRARMIFLQPRLPIFQRSERNDGQIVHAENLIYAPASCASHASNRFVRNACSDFISTSFNDFRKYPAAANGSFICDSNSPSTA